jgi:hypothetical protein
VRVFAGESFVDRPLIIILLDFYGSAIPVHTNMTYFVELRDGDTRKGNVRLGARLLSTLPLLVYLLTMHLCRLSEATQRSRSSRQALDPSSPSTVCSGLVGGLQGQAQVPSLTFSGVPGDYLPGSPVQCRIPLPPLPHWTFLPYSGVRFCFVDSNFCLETVTVIFRDCIPGEKRTSRNPLTAVCQVPRAVFDPDP